MSDVTRLQRHRVLVIDDNDAIHADFRKIFASPNLAPGFDELSAEIFGPAVNPEVSLQHFVIESALQGEEGYAMVCAAEQRGAPYSVAFVDVRMPPGWDGIETTLRLWSADPSLQVVICTAHSDYSWEETVEKLGVNGRFLILKKPFDAAEVRQLVLALSAKWEATRLAESRFELLEQKVLERTQSLREEIAHRERVERELVTAQKLEALGELVAGIAHEINNPLSYVLSNLYFVEAELQRPVSERDENTKDIVAALRETAGGALRIKRIVSDLKTFCRTDEGGMEPVDVNQVLESAMNMSRGEVNRVSNIVYDLVDCFSASANGSRLCQVFLNLIINAAQAMSAKHKATNVLTVKTRSVGDEVLVEFSDTGSGIAPDNLRKVFDPFFTTKPVGQGTGLGLSICHGILAAFKGSIEVESELDKGTTFRVRLRSTMADSSPGFTVGRAPVQPAADGC